MAANASEWHPRTVDAGARAAPCSTSARGDAWGQLAVALGHGARSLEEDTHATAGGTILGRSSQRAIAGRGLRDAEAEVRAILSSTAP